MTSLPCPLPNNRPTIAKALLGDPDALPPSGAAARRRQHVSLRPSGPSVRVSQPKNIHLPEPSASGQRAAAGGHQNLFAIPVTRASEQRIASAALASNNEHRRAEATRSHSCV